MSCYALKRWNQEKVKGSEERRGKKIKRAGKKTKGERGQMERGEQENEGEKYKAWR